MSCFYKLYVVGQVTYGILVTMYLLLLVMMKRTFCVRGESLLGKTVLVTRAGSGLGKEVAKQFALEGAFVVCWDRKHKACMDTVYDIRHYGGESVGFQCNITSPTDVMHAISATMRRVGHIDVLVNNADHLITSPVPWDEVLLRRLFDKNVFSHFWVIKAILPHMLNANKGHIIGITPATELSALSKDVPRAACKFAISGMMEALLQEIRLVPGNKVRMTCIHPYCPPCKHAAFRQLKFRITPRTTEQMAKDILKGIKSGHEVFSVPRKIYWYTNVLRCLPQDVQVFWRDFVYRKTFEEEQLPPPREETFHIPINNFRFAGQNVPNMLEYPSSPVQVYFKKPDSAITEVSIPVPEEANADWKLVVSKSPTEGQPVVFFSKEEWNIVTQETPKPLLNNSQLNTLNLPSTSTSPKYTDKLKEIMSDSGSALDVAPPSETPPPEAAQPSLLSKITDNLMNKDWLSTLYKPFSNLVLPSSRHSTAPWTLNLPDLFASNSLPPSQSVEEDHNLPTSVSHTPSVKEMESSYSCKIPDHHHRHIVAFTESEFQLKITNLNENTDNTSKDEDELLIADELLDDPVQSTEPGGISELFQSPLQTPLQSATSKFSQYFSAYDQPVTSRDPRSQDSLK